MTISSLYPIACPCLPGHRVTLFLKPQQQVNDSQQQQQQQVDGLPGNGVHNHALIRQLLCYPLLNRASWQNQGAFRKLGYLARHRQSRLGRHIRQRHPPERKAFVAEAFEGSLEAFDSHVATTSQ